MIRVLEDAGGGRIRDAATKNLVSSREVVDDYNAMRDCLARVTRDMMPFMKMLCKNNTGHETLADINTL